MIFETFSQRLRNAQRGDQPDVYQYDKASKFMCQQIAAAIAEGVGVYNSDGYEQYEANQWWDLIVRVCSKEVEYFIDFETQISSKKNRFMRVLVSTDDIFTFLDMVEIACRVMTVASAEQPYEVRGAEMSAADAIEEINGRFRQHSVGYQLHDGEIIRVDSEYAHQEVIKPALNILRGAQYSKASEDFLTAHRHYRTAEFKDAVTAANRSFESTLKAICDTEGWAYKAGDNAGQLITVVSQSGLFTRAFDKSFDSFIAMMKTGLPSIRNEAGAHGESIAAEAVTAEIARYAINMTATNILFLAECHERLQRAK